MEADELDYLLERVEASLSNADQLDYFELLRFGKNVEYAQIQVMHASDRLAESKVEAYRDRIGEMQALIADRLYLLEEAEEQQKAAQEQEQGSAAAKSSGAEDDEKSKLITEEHILQNHREAQSSISEDLLTMAQTMKESQQRFSDSIAADNALIDKTGEALEKNSSKMSQTGGRLSKYSRKSSWSWVYTYLAILVAIVAFFITIGLIRIT